MEDKIKLKILALIFATIGVNGYRFLPEGWNLLMWIPIIVGYSIYFKEGY